ncbi:keratin-associated protein 5-1-like [Pogoniulus pusillus]|uniref:keratin-associated protein 5-1-like n=1 Tax=Pogoniulus pusillus TaxID=488313 RepID=UPI0030B93C90
MLMLETTPQHPHVGSILSCSEVPISSGGFDLSCITNRYCCRPLLTSTSHAKHHSLQLPLRLRHCSTAIKGSPALCALIRSLASFSSTTRCAFRPKTMSCPEKCQSCRPCEPCCQPCGPTPLASSCNEPCCRQCQSSTVVIQPSPVVVTLPGPILSSFPQNTAIGSSTSAAVGSILSCDGVPISSGGFDLSCITNRYCCRPC